MVRCLRVASVVGLALVLHARAAHAGDPAAAREQLKIGYALSQEGKCALALPHLEESLRLDPKAITLLNLANCEEKVGKLTEALGHWVDARSRAQMESAPPIEEEAAKRAVALEKRMPRLTIAVPGERIAGMEIVRDGVVLGPVSIGTPLPVNPGRHTIVVRAPGHEPQSSEIEIAEGEAKSVDLAVGPPARSAPETTNTPRATSRTSPLVYVGFGTAAVGLGVSAVTGLIAMNRANACPDRVCPDRDALDGIESGRTLGWISTGAFVVGAVGLGLGIYGLVVSSKTNEANVTVGLGPSGAVLRGRF